jgi:hypothetical protein
MGETAADTRREIEDQRNALGSTIGQLRARRGVIAATVKRNAAIAGAAVAGLAVAVGAGLLVRRHRGGPLAAQARRLPSPLRGRAVPAARGAEGWAARRRATVVRRRDGVIDLLSERIAEQQALAERKANPLWRRTGAKALETAAAVGTAALIRRALSADRREADPSPKAEPEPAEVQGRRHAKEKAEAGATREP